MIDEAELFYKIESKQFELDYNNSFDKDIREYKRTSRSIRMGKKINSKRK